MRGQEQEELGGRLRPSRMTKESTNSGNARQHRDPSLRNYGCLSTAYAAHERFDLQLFPPARHRDALLVRSVPMSLMFDLAKYVGVEQMYLAPGVKGRS